MQSYRYIQIYTIFPPHVTWRETFSPFPLQVLLSITLRTIRAIILPFNLLNHPLHLNNLLLPLLLGELVSPPEQLLIRLSVAASQTIPQSRVLAIVIVEVQVVHGVTRSAVYERAVGQVFAVVDEDRPELHEDEETEVCEFLHREYEGKDVVRQALHEAVDGVEGHGRIGGWHDPLVVRLVQMLIDEGVVQAPVDEVDDEIGEEEEQWELSQVVPQPRAVYVRVVELGVTADLGEEEWSCEEGNEGHGIDGLAYLHLDLVLEEFGVLEDCLVEDKDVGEGRNDEVN